MRKKKQKNIHAGYLEEKKREWKIFLIVKISNGHAIKNSSGLLKILMQS
jgi:hypothetical protein